MVPRRNGPWTRARGRERRDSKHGSGMKICVVGAGAIGGLLGARLANSGHDVSVVARGAHLQAIRFDGLQVQMNDGEVVKATDLEASDDIASLGVHDLVILGLKAHQIEAVADDLPSLFHDDSIVLTAQNGIPWWYFQRHGGPLDGTALKSLDPEGRISRAIHSRRIIGCIAYPAAEIIRPGVIRHIEGVRFPVGELDGSDSERARNISQLMVSAGFKSPVLDNIRAEIWLKAWGNLSFNPISALTHSTLVDICQHPDGHELAATMMTEAQTVAESLGISFRVPLEKRIAGAERVGKHKTSMLQDVECGKALETEAIIGAVVELGELTGVPTPTIRAIYQAVRLLSHTLVEETVCVRADPLADSAATQPLKAVRAGTGR